MIWNIIGNHCKMIYRGWEKMIPRLKFASHLYTAISTQIAVCCAALQCVFLCLTPGHNCEFLPCEASNPCENGAVCVEELDQDHFPLGFRCHCRRGFTGPRCEINVDECSSSPCFHGFCYDGKKQPISPTCLIAGPSRWKRAAHTHTCSDYVKFRFAHLRAWQAVFNWVTIATNKGVMRVELFHLMWGSRTLPAAVGLISSLT